MTEVTSGFPGPDAIIFDLSEVYLRGLLGTHELVSEHLDLPMDSRVFSGESLTQLFHGETTEAEYWETVITRNNWDTTVGDLEALVRQNFYPIEGTEAIIRELKDNGYPLGLLSVHVREWIKHCEQEFPIRELFDVVMYSFEHGVSKPDTRAYELILGAMDVEADRSVFIDDIRVNIEAAQSMGMHGILFTSAPQLRTDLVDLGIL